MKKPPIRGLAFHFCSCPVPCPCMFNEDDVEGCNITRVFHITDGGYVGKHISGLTAVLVPHPPALIKTTRLKTDQGHPLQARLYIPKGLAEKQERELLGTLYENYMDLVGLRLKKVYAPIRFRAVTEALEPSKNKPVRPRPARKGYDVEIPSILHVRTFPLRGANDQPITVNHLNLGEGELWTIGRSVRNDFQAPDEKEWAWKLPQTNGSWTQFQWDWYDRA